MKKGDNIIVNNHIRDPEKGTDTGPMFQIRFLEGGGRGIYGIAVEGGSIFCMYLVVECNTSSHTWKRGSGEELPGGKERAWLVIYPPAPRLPPSELFQTLLSGSRSYKVKSLEGLLMSTYILG